MSEKQDRQYVRTASELERKYNFGKSFAEAIGLATDAREYAENTAEEMEDKYTEFKRTTEEIVLRATTSAMTEEDVVTIVSSELKQTAEDISMLFKSVESLDEADGEQEAEIQKIQKHIVFSAENAITITSGDNSVKLVLDNDNGIEFSKNGVTLGKWDGDNFYAGNIVIKTEEKAQFGNFAFIPRSDGSMSFLKVGG